MLSSLAVLLPFYLIIGVGLIAGRFPLLARGSAAINEFVFYVALPAFLFVTLARSDLSGGVPWAFVLLTVIVTAGVGTLWASLGAVLPAIRRFSPTSIGLASSYGNVSYFGVPIVLVILGPEAALAAGIGQLVHNVVFLTGYPLVKVALQHRTGGSRSSGEVWTTIRRGLLTNPLVLSVGAGLACAALFPGAESPVLESISLIGQAAVPCALYAIGITLHRALARMRSEASAAIAVLYASFAKVALLPLASLAAVVVFTDAMSATWAATLVLMAAMPVSASAFVLAERYEQDSFVVTGSIAVTSTIALATVPAFAWLVTLALPPL